MNPHYPVVARRAANRCEYCRAPEAIANFPFEVEHVLPQTQGGTNDQDNLALACRSCNLFKSDAILAPDPATGQNARLFHPRRDVWAEHFVADAITGQIAGLTSVGRATIARLQMNSVFQQEARILWARLGLYP
jgi:hypothetical protein